VDNFFHPINKPPKEYYVPDHILEKPGRINLKEVNSNAPKTELAGRLTEIGKQILLIGSQKAKFICTGQWDFEYTKGQQTSTKSSFRPGNEKITNFNAFDFIEKPSKMERTPKQPLEIDRL
jgi:hypothetical protein